MKIQKFNESYRGNKVIKLYDNSILAEYQKDVEESTIIIKDLEKKLSNKKEAILKLINEYITLNRKYFNDKYWSIYDVIDFYYYIDEDTKTPKFGVKFRWSKDNTFLIYKDFEGLLEFIENPDLYRTTNKYNL